MKCPTCNAEIDSDSLYCDQCGAGLLRCTQCGEVRKGKFCPVCGKPTIGPDGKQAAAPSAVAQPVKPAPEVVRPTTNPDPAGDTSAASPMRIVCKALGIDLPLRAGAVIGRKAGDYAERLGGCNYLSRNHARIDFDGVRWTVTDLGSTNGTSVNGAACRPTLPFGKGDIICFATKYDFEVL